MSDSGGSDDVSGAASAQPAAFINYRCDVKCDPLRQGTHTRTACCRQQSAAHKILHVSTTVPPLTPSCLPLCFPLNLPLRLEPYDGHPCLYLYEVMVAAPFQRLGLGSRLMQLVEEMVRGGGKGKGR